MKIFFSTLFMLIFLTATTSAAEPVRIARLPIIFQCTLPDDDGARAALERQLERATHIPLNGTLQVAEYLSPIDSVNVFNDIWQKISAANKKAKFAEAMRPLAAELDADIIVCPIVHRYSQILTQSFNWYGDMIIDSRAQVELIVYDRRTDNLADKKASRMYYDTWSGTGTAAYLASICFEKVIADTKLHELIMSIGK